MDTSTLDSHEVSYRLPEWSEVRRAFREYKDISFEDENNIRPSEVYDFRILKEINNLERYKAEHYKRKIRDTAELIDIMLYKLTQVNRDVNKYIERKFKYRAEAVLALLESPKFKIIDRAMPYFNILNKNILEKMAKNIGCKLTGKENRVTLVKTIMMNEKIIDGFHCIYYSMKKEGDPIIHYGIRQLVEDCLEGTDSFSDSKWFHDFQEKSENNEQRACESDDEESCDELCDFQEKSSNGSQNAEYGDSEFDFFSSDDEA